MIRTRNIRRRGFTLIELLVVMGIIVVLGSLALLISPRFVEDQRTTRGADHVQGWILVAKMRAYRDQQPRGVRLVIDPNSPANAPVVRELIYIERPEDLRGDPDPDPVIRTNDHNHLQLPAPAAIRIPAGGPPNSYVFVPNWDLETGGIVQTGDFLKINTYETQPYNIHRIANVRLVQQPFGTVLRLAAGDGPGGSAGTPSIVLPGGRIAIDADTRYQIIRQARPLAGEPNLPMPRDVVIDLNAATNGTSILPGAGTPDALDILFSQRGQVMGNNANSGKIILRVRQGDKAANYGEQIFIVINTRTGLISAHPFNDDQSGANDWYRFTRDGKDSGM